MAHAQPDPRIRVLLLLPSLHGGGAERVAVHLMNRCDPSRFDVRMGLLQRSGPYLEQVDQSRIDSPGSSAESLDYDGGNRLQYKASAMLARGALVPKAIHGMIKRARPDVVMSFRKGMSIATMVATSMYGRKKLRWIAREGNNTMAVIRDELKGSIGRAMIKKLTRRCYSSADRLLAISDGLAAQIRDDLGVPEQRIHRIFNPVDLELVATKARAMIELVDDRPIIVGVGRLQRQKAFDLALKAFAQSKAQQSHRLVLVGTGPDEGKLKGLCGELGIANIVTFTGWAENPWAYMARAEAFVLPSLWEGFGCVVIEAMACGVPVVVTDCDFGPREIVKDGEFGVVCPTGEVAPFAAGIDRVLFDQPFRERLIETGPTRAADFSIPNTVGQYEALFSELASGR